MRLTPTGATVRLVTLDAPHDECIGEVMRRGDVTLVRHGAWDMPVSRRTGYPPKTSPAWAWRVHFEDLEKLQ